MLELLDVILIIITFLSIIYILNDFSELMWFLFRSHVLTKKLIVKNNKCANEALITVLNSVFAHANVNKIRIIMCPKTKTLSVEVGNDYETKTLVLDNNYSEKLLEIREYFAKERFIKDE